MKKTSADKVKKIEQELSEPVLPIAGPIDIDPNNFLGSGSTLINLTSTDNPWCCYGKGKYHLMVGDSATGKTWLTLCAFAEAARRPDFDSHRFIYDNVEDGALMDMGFYFGQETVDRIEPPRISKEGVPIYSETAEDFYDNLKAAQSDGRPFIYILDSMDALSSHSELDKLEEQRKARLKGKKASGSYGDGKAKINSGSIREAVRDLAKTDSILIIVNQTRDNLGFGFETKGRSGGHALRFYATLELWLSLAGQIKKKVKEKDHTIGNKTLVKIKKNRYTGKLRRCTVPIFYSYGLDDIGSCIDFLIEQKVWSSSAGKVQAPQFNFSGSIPKLIRWIEDNNKEDDLREIVGETWDEVENLLKMDRKRKYP